MLQLRDTSKAKYETAGTGPKDIASTMGNEILQVAGLCLFSSFVRFDQMAPKLLEAVTGWSFDPAAQKDTFTRVMDMRHAFNLREGQKPSDLVLPPRCVGEPPLKEGPTAGATIDHKGLGREFFAGMEWDNATGKPSRKSMEALGGMDDVIEDLHV